MLECLKYRKKHNYIRLEGKIKRPNMSNFPTNHITFKKLYSQMVLYLDIINLIYSNPHPRSKDFAPIRKSSNCQYPRSKKDEKLRTLPQGRIKFPAI